MNVRWYVLKDLTIVDTSVTEDAMRQILVGAPLLEVLNLHIWDTGNNLVIDSPKLKVLSIGYRFMSRDDMVTPTSTTISAAILEILELAQLWHTWCTLEVPSLAIATIGFRHDYERMLEDTWARDLKKMTRQALMGISHVEELELNEWSVMLLIHQMENDSFVQFPNVKLLTLHVVEAVGVLNVLVMFPVLETLIVEHMQEEQYNRLESEMTFPIPSLLHLKRVNITWCMHDYDSIIPDVKTLLENAHELEKLVLRLTIDEADAELLPFETAKKVQKMWKSSRLSSGDDKERLTKFILKLHMKNNMVVQFSKVTAEADEGSSSG